MVLQAIKYTRGSLQILDQLKLPYTTHYDDIYSTTDAWHAIKEMRTRGAPAIAIVAALSLAIELTNAKISTSGAEVAAFVVEKLRYLVSSRPTAVNLADAARKLGDVVLSELNKVKDGADGGESVRRVYVEAAEKMLVDDVRDNESIGRYGAEWIVKNSEGELNGRVAKEGAISVLTHCNTGSLATAGYGTALGVIRALHSNGALKHAFCTETRPYNQGSRLTAYELVHDKIPATLITDSMAAALLKLKGPTERIAAIVVGADRVAANGDTANKIGTYSLAIIAKHHGVKFLVAAPRTTIDLSTPSGNEIVIEERPGKEVSFIRGPKFNPASHSLERSVVETIAIAAENIDIWNPAFDVTPAKLIDGIITEVGVAEKDGDGNFNLKDIFDTKEIANKPPTVGGI